ncbi:MAG: hypothetical protein QOF78_1701 [Phycisphaerales bacterium]|jgi:hypothetical protein|nr:hypothetical protein [Phycisphaerales bacterium]MEA2736477.1 hypothetical protein [Humisphaera sp.]
MASTTPPMPFTPAAAVPFAGVAAAPGLSPEQLKQITDARNRSKKIRKGVNVALFDGWSIAIFAGLTLLSGLFSFVGLLLGAGMAAAAFIELKGVKRLRALDLDAPKTLAWNQVFLGGLLFTYAVYSLWTVYTGRTELATQLDAYPEMAYMAANVSDLARLIGTLVYGTLIVVAVVCQGGTALFYLSRRKYMEAYLRETPQWIIDAQRAGMPM